MVSERRAMVVITEGATPALLNQWCAEGRLPAFSRLRALGAWGSLQADGVPYEPPGLLSFLTGSRPGDHGFYSYWTCHSSDYRPVVLGSEERRLPLLWQRPEFQDLRFASIGLFGTHPAEPLDGWLITYPMRPTLHGCYPRGLQRELDAEGIRPVHDVSVWWDGGRRASVLERLLEADRRRAAAAERLYERGADVTIVNLTAIDRTSHIFWQELERDDLDSSQSAVFAAYKTADEVLESILDKLDGNTTLIAFSEIGFGPVRSYCSINDVLASAGLLTVDTNGNVDFAASKAFEAVQGTHGVNINLVGRYAQGTVTSKDYERLCKEVAEVLLDSINPRTGLPLIRSVFPRERVYPGAATDLAPDLILEPYDWRYLPLGDPSWAHHVHRTWQSGWHRPDSYWAVFGPGIESTTTSAAAARPVDMAATLTASLGKEIPKWCAGRVLAAEEGRMFRRSQEGTQWTGL